MDGLECSEINRSELERTLRIDSEFYSKSAIKVSDMLQSRSHDLLTTFVDVSDGNHMGISDCFIDEGVPYYRGQDAGAFFIENSNPICINEKTFELPVMKRSHLKKGDVILSIVGTIGSLSLVYSDKSATCSCKLAILRPKEGKSAELLATFLRGKYGQAQITRFTRGAVQKGLILEDMDQLVVPTLGDRIVEAIKNAVQSAYQIQEKANIHYREAQRTLMNAIGSILVPAESVSVRNISSSFYTTGRLDAEYYQPKYDEYWRQLQEFEKTSIPTEYEVFKNSGTNYADGVNDIGVIKTKQLSNNGIDTNGVESFFTIQACIENKSTYLRKNDVVFASMVVGSLGKVSLFFPDGKKQFVTDSTLRIYRAKTSCRVLPEVLCVFLQSHLGQEMIYRYVVGSTGIINIYDDDMAKIPVPILNMDVQKEIAAKVQESFALRKQSRQLLEYAKQAVEMAIEQGEGVALKWLKDKIPVEV